MPVQRCDVQVGAFFITASKQLRKVTKIETDLQSRERVHYLTKSARIASREFNFGHLATNPPLMDSFITDCDHPLSATEISGLRVSNIILPNE
jgi:hypothetical protein